MCDWATGRTITQVALKSYMTDSGRVFAIPALTVQTLLSSAE